MKFIFHLKSFHFPLLDQLSKKLIIEREGRGGVELVAGLVTRKESQLYLYFSGDFFLQEFETFLVPERISHGESITT